ncbi:hypothetical protein EOPP23_11790 [Endozoicomonas sp. OPT23]|uniref:hypothetical protein n=1 Tax=Endozoicomonas sp. OPT23 TaxID=2072845 RepID=UPI00129B67C3|nr:hypothetical protein [Endozoicomonas sp. OPT23]MRI33667.1 hypothetical protein [Endozoicomonas sp. OPT23]
MRLKKGVAGLLAFLMAFMAEAELRFLPNVPDYSVLREFEDAFYHHFRSRQLTIEAIPTYRRSDFESYRVKVAGQLYYVRLVPSDCRNCSSLRFDLEWQLKKEVETESRLAELNIFRILPESAATFVFQRRRYYLASFPVVSAVSLEDLYRQVWFSSPYSLTSVQQQTLARVFYRIGQSLAVFALDPSLPSETSKDILKRVVKTRLSDRSARNQLFNDKTDAIFFVDLIASEDNPLKHQSVERLLQQWLGSYLDLIELLSRQSSFQCGRQAECIAASFEDFLSGFQSMLPSYNKLLLKNILSELLAEQLALRCSESNISTAFCTARSRVSVSRYFRLR